MRNFINERGAQQYRTLSLQQELDIENLLQEYDTKAKYQKKPSVFNIQQFMQGKQDTNDWKKQQFRKFRNHIDYASVVIEIQKELNLGQQNSVDYSAENKLEIKNQEIKIPIKQKYILDQFNDTELEKLRLDQNDLQYLENKYTNIKQQMSYKTDFPCIQIVSTDASKWFQFNRKKIETIKDCAIFKIFDCQYQFYLLEQLYCFYSKNNFCQPFKTINHHKNKGIKKFSISKCCKFICIAFTDQIAIYQIKEKNIVLLKNIQELNNVKQISHIGFYGKRYQKIYMVSDNKELFLISIQNNLLFYSVNVNKLQICLNSINFVDHTIHQVDKQQYYLFAITNNSETAIYLIEPFRQLLYLENFEDDFIKIKINGDTKNNKIDDMLAKAIWRCSPSSKPQIIISYWNKILIIRMKQFNINSNPIEVQFYTFGTFINKFPIKNIALLNYNQLLIHAKQNLVDVAIPLISSVDEAQTSWEFFENSIIYTNSTQFIDFYYKLQCNRQIAISNQINILKLIKLQQFIDSLIAKSEYRMMFGILILIFKQLNYSFQFSYQQNDLTKQIYYCVESLLNTINKIPNVEMKSIRIYWICELLFQTKRISLLWTLVFNFVKKYSLVPQFFNCLEIFILQQQINDIPTQIFQELVKYLCDINHAKSLLKVMFKINLEEHDLEKYLHLIGQKQMYSLYIYLFQNLGENEMDFLTPFIKIFSIFNHNFQVQGNDTNYFGNMCLWYLQKCFKGQKFPNIKMTQNEKNVMIKNLLIEIFNPIFLQKLIQFNCKVLLEVLLYVFEDKQIIEFISNDNDKLVAKVSEYYPDNEIQFKQFHGFIIQNIKILIKKSKQNTQYIVYYEYFVILCSHFGLKIKEETLLESIIYFLNHFQKQKSYLYFAKIENNPLDFDLQTLLLKMIKQIKEFLKSKDYLKKILKIQIKNEQIKSYLNLIAENYKISLEILLHSKTYKKDIFQLINEIMNEIQQSLKIADFLEVLKEQVLFLVKLNPRNTIKIFRKYKYDESLLLDQVRNFPEIKFELLNAIILDNQYQFIEQNIELLKEHLNLLCEIHGDKVLEYMNIINYPLDQGIQICENQSHFEGVAFLQEKSGNICASLLSIQKAIKQLLKSQDLTENQIKIKKKLSNYFNYCIYLCKSHYAPNGSNQQQNYWIILLEMIGQFDSPDIKTKKVYLLIQLEKYFNQVLKNIFSQVPLIKIIKYFTGNKIKTISHKIKSITWVTLFHLLKFQKRIFLQTINQFELDCVKILEKFTDIRGKAIFSEKITCGMCQQPLLEQKQVIMFSCSHIFHQICHKQLSCLTCRFQSDAFYYLNLINKGITKISQVKQIKKIKKQKQKEQQIQDLSAQKSWKNRQNQNNMITVNINQLKKQKQQIFQLDRNFNQYFSKGSR